MKDKIKNALLNVVLVVNLPFYTIRVLVMIVPMIIVHWFYAGYEEDDEKLIRLSCCISAALWMSGPIGAIHTIMKWLLFGTSMQETIDEVFYKIRKRYPE